MISRALRLLLLGALSLGAVQDERWETARPDYAWQFPRDHWAHPSYMNEWWYFTGHLTDTRDSSRSFGYQFTFFRVGVLPAAPSLNSNWSAQMLIMGHAAITDVTGRTHTFSEVLYRAAPVLGGFGGPGDSLVAWSRGPAGTDARWRLRLDGDGFAFSMADRRRAMGLDLRTRPGKPLVLHGPNGYSAKSATSGVASQYYSMTRLETEGTLLLGGRAWAVRGISWMDKEFGSNQLARDQVGWDWFSLQLDDGRELMLYLLRDSTGATSFASGTAIAAGGAPRHLAAEAFTVRSTARWTSDSTGASYPSRWQVAVPSESLVLDIAPLVADQENRSALVRGLFYWEGAVRVRDPAGRPVGRGFVELVGYGKGLRPAL